jgi:hypothetical protein
MVGVKAALVDLPIGDGLSQGATRFLTVLTVSELAVADPFPEFHKPV